MAVMSLVIEAIGTTVPAFLSYSTSPVSSSMISAAADRRSGASDAPADSTIAAAASAASGDNRRPA